MHIVTKIATARKVQFARALADELRAEGIRPPLRIVPDGDGGIVLARHDPPISKFIEITAGGVEVLVFRDNQVCRRQRWEFDWHDG